MSQSPASHLQTKEWLAFSGPRSSRLRSLWRMDCMYWGMPKGTTQAETMLNSEKIRLEVIELHLPDWSVSKY